MQLARMIKNGFAAERDDAIAMAQVRGFARQAPTLFLMLGSNVVAVAFTHRLVAPAWLTVILPGLLVALLSQRAYSWNRTAAKAAAASGQEAAKRLRTMTVSGFSICMITGVWGIALSRYGDIGTRMHVLLFFGLSMVVAISCVANIRSSSQVVTVTAISLIVYFGLSSEPTLAMAALSCAVTFGAMSLMQQAGYSDFRKLIAVVDDNRRLALTDPLTGLPNRRSFFERLQACIDQASSAKGTFTVGIIDLDGFKPVNDTFGHHAGDEVLREVANRLENIMEGVGWAGRLGGDEFGLIIESERDLEKLGRAICASIQMPYALRDATAQIGASVGFAQYPTAAATGEMLVERADYALYFAKSCQRGAAICFAPEHEARLRSQAIIEQALRSADFESEFHLVYQPIIDVVEARVDAYEALARWTCPSLGPVSPADFIAVAERSGLILDLTQVLLGKALAAMAAWPDDVRLSFNLSAQDIASAEGLLRITSLIQDSGIDPRRIIFEVTETGLMRDLVDAQHALNELKSLGVRIALDDFGTGYSSLSYVHRLPINKLKIDRSFVTHICEDKACLNVIRSLIDLSRNLNYACIVEGVETTDQFLMLRSAGCRFMQGYLFSKPMPQTEIDAFHRQPLAIAADPGATRAESAPRPALVA